MSRRAFGKTLGLGLGAAAAAPLASFANTQVGPGPARPNFVFINTDNQSSKHTGYAGHPVVKTPNLDRLARRGVAFTNAYCGSPVCSPGRASMMTGLYPSDNNSYCNSTPWDGSQPTWGSRLRDAGYYTRSIGKLGLHDQFDSGFEEFESSHQHAPGQSPDITALFRRPLCYRMGERPNVTGGSREQRHPDAGLTALAIRFLSSEAPRLNEPWALNVGFGAPHVSFFERRGFEALQKYWDMYPLYNIDMPNIPEGHLDELHIVMQALRHYKRIATPIGDERVRRARAGYYGMISELDEYVGEIWNVLEQTGQLENTIFIYTSDNGISMGEHGIFFHNNLYEESASIPLLIAGAGIPRGVVVETPVAHVDAVATMLVLAGADRPAGLRGHSLLPLMEGVSADHPGFAYSENHSEGNVTGSFMVRKGDWKYIHFTWDEGLLFNLAEDPGEFHNRIDDPAARAVLEELKGLLHSQVDPEAVTVRAFQKQEGMLREMANRLTEEELYRRFEFRLGPAQARALAAKYKGR